jgi:hypothetical protein
MAGVKERMLPLVLIASGVVSGLGGAASSVSAVRSGEEQQAAHVRMEQKLDKLLELERQHAERLARMEEGLSWVVRGRATPPSQPRSAQPDGENL